MTKQHRSFKMDEIEIELMKQEFSEVDTKSTSPEWFLIGMGLVDTSPAKYNKAREIYLQFLKFQATPFAETFEDVLSEFNLAKLHNRL